MPYNFAPHSDCFAHPLPCIFSELAVKKRPANIRVRGSFNITNATQPDITFFHEDLPDTFHDRLNEVHDQVDLVIVIGTSLKVAPVAEIPGFMPANVPQIYISRDVRLS